MFSHENAQACPSVGQGRAQKILICEPVCNAYLPAVAALQALQAGGVAIAARFCASLWQD
jgi:hypothetical protein